MSERRLFSPAKLSAWHELGAVLSDLTAWLAFGGHCALAAAPAGIIPVATMRSIMRTSWKEKERSPVCPHPSYL